MIRFLLILLFTNTIGVAQKHNWFPKDVAETRSSIAKSLREKKLPASLSDPLAECLIQKIILKCPYREMLGEEMKKPGFLDSVAYSCTDVIVNYVMTTNDSTLKFGDLKENIPAMIKACAGSYDRSAMKVELNPEKYCRCVIEEMVQKNYPVKTIQDVFDENSEVYNELFLPCVSKAGIKVNGKPKSLQEKIELPLIRAGNTYKVKGALASNKTRYFLLDSGADYVFISEADEKELVQSGALKPSQYLDKINVVLGDGSETSAKAIVSSLKFGEHVFEEVILCVIKECPVPLLGKSFLDRFSTWTIDNENSKLVLVK